jgi:hypothetical protein
MSRSPFNVVFQMDPKLEKSKSAVSTVSKTPDTVSVASSDESSLSSSPKAQSLDNLWIGAAILDQMAANSSNEQGGSAGRNLRAEPGKERKAVVPTSSAKGLL